MKTKLLLTTFQNKVRSDLRLVIGRLFLILALSPVPSALSQIPQGFNYQAIARDGSGNPIVNGTLKVKLSVLSDTMGFYASGGGTYIWEEEQINIKTNAFGLFTVVFGNSSATKAGGTAASFSAIDWARGPLFIGTKIANPTVYKILGSAKLWSVPYSMVTDSTKALLKGSKLAVVSDNDGATDALFEVKRKDGQTVFAVYPNAVNIYVPRTAKGTKGGFAIGGFESAKTGPQDYFRVTPDSIRMYIDKTPNLLKGATKGGFAIGGFDQAKNTTLQDLFTVSNDSIRIYLDANPAPGKGATKGGFAIGGFDQAKGTNVSFLNVSTDTTGIINPSQNRILWYPLKNAFLTGKIIIEHKDSVGLNSFSTGYLSRGKGKYSQAMGYKTIARGDYSTAIGKNAIAASNNSFAFGDSAYVSGKNSYAFGTYAKATGNMSFALGSVGVDSTGKKTGQTIASGYGAFAIGFGSVASGQGAFTLGVADTASGPFSSALGYQTTAKGWYATSMGYGTKAKAPFSTAIGWSPLVEDAGWCGFATGVLTKAGNWAAVATGDRTYASGHISFASGYKSIASGQMSSAFGEQTVAQSRGSMSIGAFNVISGDPNNWNSWDPLFVIGNGTSITPRNALTVYKNGNMELDGLLNKNLIASEALELNYGGTGNRFSLIDFHSDDTYSDFSFRILRNTGANGSTDIIHRGTGTFDIMTQDISPLVFSTSNAERMRVEPNGNVGINHSSPGQKLDIAGGYGRVQSGYSWLTNSDIRFKKNISELEGALEKVLRLRGVRFDLTDDQNYSPGNGKHIGFIAQELEELYPEFVITDENGYKSVAYDKMGAVLVEAVKEQQKIIDAQNSELKSLRQEVEQIKILLSKNGVK